MRSKWTVRGLGSLELSQRFEGGAYDICVYFEAPEFDDSTN